MAPPFWRSRPFRAPRSSRRRFNFKGLPRVMKKPERAALAVIAPRDQQAPGCGRFANRPYTSLEIPGQMVVRE